MCLLDLSRWRSRLVPIASSNRLVGRDGERGVLMRFRNLFHGIFMNWESIAVRIGHLIYIACI